MPVICQVKRNDKGKIKMVTNHKEKPSNLYKSIVPLVDYNLEDALPLWAQVYTNSFKEWWGSNWEVIDSDSFPTKDTMFGSQGYVDEHGEPQLRNIHSNPHFMNSRGETLPLTGDNESLADLKEARVKLNKAKAKTTLVNVLNNLASAFKIPYEIVDNENFDWTGKVVDGTVWINIAHANLGDALHEYAHLFIEIIREQNPALFDNLIASIKKEYPDVYKDVKKARGDLRDYDVEAIVEALGRVTEQKINWMTDTYDWIQKIIEAIRGLLNSAIGRKYEPAYFDENSTIADLAHTLAVIAASKNVEVSGADALNIEDDIFYRKKSQRGSKNKRTFKSEKLKAKMDALKLFLDKNALDMNGKPNGVYRSGSKSFHRLGGWVRNNFVEERQGIARKTALRVFKRRGIDPKGKVTALDGNEYNLDGYEKYWEKIFEGRRIYGLYFHLYMQWVMEKDPKKKADMVAEMNDLAKQKFDTDGIGIKPGTLKWIEDNAKDVVLGSGILHHFGPESENKIKDREDHVLTEFQLYSDFLGIGTRIDGLVESVNGEYSIVDWKTGDLLSDDHELTRMAYGRDGGLMDTKLDTAKMEVMLRALMIREHQPEARFKMLTINHVNQQNEGVSVYNVEVADYLKAIELWVKDNKDEVTYEAMKKKGLFDPSQYIGKSMLLDEFNWRHKNTPPKEKLEAAKAKLSGYYARYSKEEIDNNTALSDKVSRISRMILEMEKDPNTQLDTDKHDISGFRRFFDNLWDTKNTWVKVFSKVFFRQKTKARHEADELDKKHDEKFLPILKEYLQGKGMTQLVNTLTLKNINSIPLVGGLKTAELYNFMWREYNEPHFSGLFANMEDTYRDFNTGREIPLTAAQKAYRDFYHDAMRENYHATMHAQVYDPQKDKDVPKYYLHKGATKELEKLMMPRVPMASNEVRERAGSFWNKVKAEKDYFVQRHLQTYIEQHFHNTTTTRGVPLKYLVKNSSEIVESQNHSLNAQDAFKRFNRGLIMKKHLDEVYSMGEGLRSYLSMKKTDMGGTFKNTAKMLEDQILLHVLDLTPADRITSKPIEFTVGKQKIVLSPEKAALTLKHAVSAMTMFIRPVAGFANGVLITMLNLLEASKGSMARLAGFPPEDIDYGLWDYVKAHKDYLNYLVHTWKGTSEQSKLWQMAKQTNYLTDNYDYRVQKNELLGAKNKIWDRSHLYMFHTIWENYGSLMIMSAQMQSRMVDMGDGTKKSMWDLYKRQDDGSFAYEGPVRGIVETAPGVKEELRGFHSQEIKHMQRVSERIHGAYRQDERVSAELYILGQWVLQFKKFVPTLIKNLYSSRHVDASMGKWVVQLDKDGNPVQNKLKDGTMMNVYEWESRMQEGRARLMLNMMISMGRYLTGKDSKYTSATYRMDSLTRASGLTNEDRMNLLHSFNTMMIFVAMMLAKGAIPDDEKDKYWFARFEKLQEDITQGAYPIDLLRSLNKPTSIIPKTLKIGEAFVQFLGEGVIGGERDEYGNRSGMRELWRHMPVGAGLNNWRKMFEDIERTEDWKFLGIMRDPLVPNEHIIRTR